MANTKNKNAKATATNQLNSNVKMKKALPKPRVKQKKSNQLPKDNTTTTNDKENPKQIDKSAVPSTTTIESNLFQCNLCQTDFSEIKLLESHVRQCHFIENPYACSCCLETQEFWDLKDFLRHTNETHSNVVAGLSFKCRHCTDTFSDENTFIQHDQLHDKDTIDFRSKLNDCYECGDNFATLNELIIHQRLHNNAAKPYNCDQCSYSFTRSEDYNIHRRLHQGIDIFECLYCERLFAQAKNLSQHIRRAHQDSVDPNNMIIIEEIVGQYMRKTHDEQQEIELNENRTISELPMEVLPIAETTLMSNGNSEIVPKFQCFLCDLAFVKEKSLQIHCRRNHNGQYTDEQLREATDKQSTPVKANIPKNRQYSCSLSCDTKPFTTKYELFEHLQQKHAADKPYKCRECQRTFATTKTLSKHIEVHDRNRRPTCKYCGLQFVQFHSMVKHQKRHEGDAIHLCPICSMPFQAEKFLQRHMRVHANGKPHKCTHCDKTFAQSCDKMKHMRIHTGERPYSCTVCGKTFAHLTSINKHSFVHTNERAFQCSVCGKSFQHKSNLVVHMRMHTGERPYRCTVCAKTFYASGHYNDHMRIHSGTKSYRCDVCDKAFVHQSSYQKHKKVHTGEKPNRCQLCDKRFSQPGHLKEHMRIHTGEKPYQCRECVKSFRRSDALQSHMKIHRGDKQGSGSAVINQNTVPQPVAITTILDYQQPAAILLENTQMTPTTANVTATVREAAEDFTEFIKFDNTNFLNAVDTTPTTTTIAIVPNNTMLTMDDNFNAFTYHFQL